MKVEDLDGLLLDHRLPRLAVAGDLDALTAGLREHEIDVLLYDPLYLSLLAGSSLQATNLYDTGPLLSAVTRACLDAGATPLLVHHTRKAIALGEPAELDDLAFAGVAEFARQWMLVNRRERFDPEQGVHRLWLGAGGSCGQSGLWAVDVDEGRLAEDFSGRKWEVTVTPAGKYWDAQLQERETRKSDAKRRQEEDDDRALLVALDRLDPRRCGAGLNRLREHCGFSRERVSRAVARLVEQGVVGQGEVDSEIGSGARRKVPGVWRVGGQR
jgi:hypothetical protein